MASRTGRSSRSPPNGNSTNRGTAPGDSASRWPRPRAAFTTCAQVTRCRAPTTKAKPTALSTRRTWAIPHSGRDTRLACPAWVGLSHGLAPCQGHRESGFRRYPWRTPIQFPHLPSTQVLCRLRQAHAEPCGAVRSRVRIVFSARRIRSIDCATVKGASGATRDPSAANSIASLMSSGETSISMKPSLSSPTGTLKSIAPISQDRPTQRSAHRLASDLDECETTNLLRIISPRVCYEVSKPRRTLQSIGAPLTNQTVRPLSSAASYSSEAEPTSAARARGASNDPPRSPAQPRKCACRLDARAGWPARRPCAARK